MRTARSPYERYVIKSFKHDGSLHRVWQENWEVPPRLLHPAHADGSVWVYLNDRTVIVENDGKTWISRTPAVSFFLPNEWFNVVALLENKGIRYYCNLASPPYRYEDVLTYIDYDLDIVMLPDGSMHELDWDEFVRHKAEYKYSETVQSMIENGLRKLKLAMQSQSIPFGDEYVHRYYEEWKNWTNTEGDDADR